MTPTLRQLPHPPTTGRGKRTLYYSGLRSELTGVGTEDLVATSERPLTMVTWLRA